jgi:hypothetical protein
MGPVAAPDLRKALDGKPSAEMRQRIKHLLDKLRGATDSPEALRAMRAVEALEQVGTPEARRMLGGLAKGAPGARLTTEAKAALARWTGRP